jgi:hypothetical protein
MKPTVVVCLLCLFQFVFRTWCWSVPIDVKSLISSQITRVVAATQKLIYISSIAPALHTIELERYSIVYNYIFFE